MTHIRDLETLVPPYAACKKIPKGEFKDSALVWVCLGVKNSAERLVLVPRTEKRLIQQGFGKCPAPTLVEIWEELKEAGLKVSFSRLRYDRRWYASVKDPNTAGPGCLRAEDKKSSTNAALKVWLKLKGINYEG